MAIETRKWPQIHDLLSWWIFYKLDSVSDGELTPQFIGDCIKDVYRSAGNHPKLHKELYEQYEEFQKEFMPPDA